MHYEVQEAVSIMPYVSSLGILVSVIDDKLAVDGMPDDEIALGDFALYATIRFVILFATCVHVGRHGSLYKKVGLLTLHQRISIRYRIPAGHGGSTSRWIMRRNCEGLEESIDRDPRSS